MGIRRRWCSTLVALVVLAGCGSGGGGPADECAPPTNVLLCKRPLNIAHRGGAALAPENTMAAFENAVALGADALEADLFASSDGVVVCVHDVTVDRTTDGTGFVTTRTYAELQALDAGYWYTRDRGATFPYRGTGVRITSLEELLTSFPEKFFSLDVKQVSPPIVDEVLAVLRRTRMLDRVLLASGHDNVLADARIKEPGLLTAFGGNEIQQFLALTPEAEASYLPPARVLQASFLSLGDSTLAKASRFGLVSQAFTVNDRATMERLLDSGVDGILTDDPALLAQVLAERPVPASGYASSAARIARR